MQEVLDRYPDNKIVWMHMGLSLELKTLPATEHIRLMSSMLDRHPNLMLDITWRIIDDNYFSREDQQPQYVAFLNRYSDRILPGTDFLASSNKTFRCLQDGVGGHQPDPGIVERRGVSEYRVGGELLPGAGAGLRGAEDVVKGSH